MIASPRRVGPVSARVKSDGLATSVLLPLYPPKTDIHREDRDVSKVPILLQKSFWGCERKFLGPLMRFTHGDVRGHVV
jgi:hypothetical protein